MATPQNQIDAVRRNQAKNKERGIRQHTYFCHDSQVELVKAFIRIAKSLKNPDALVGLDISDDGETIKLIYE